MMLHQLDARVRRMLSELKGLIARESVAVEGIETAPRGSGDFRAFDNGSEWSKDDPWQVFRFTARVPQGFRGRVKLCVKTGREGLWEAVNPQILVAINGRVESAFDTRHPSIVLQERAQPGAAFDVRFEAYAQPPEKGQVYPVLDVRLCDTDWALEQLCYDIENPYAAAIMMPEGEREREVTLEVLARALDRLDLREPWSEAFERSVGEARAYLKTEYYDARAALQPVAVADCVGHTHIDVAWLWDIEQTRHKAARSFATVLNLMDRYPEYKFMSSQPALYQYVKEDQPELYERIKAQIAAGRWQPEGGMWLEADCNLTSGESLVRQFLHGQEFFEREFGKRSRVLWLPDVFGYSAALPQIMKGAGIDYFMTTKISWNEYNLLPYDTFVWRGIDGSEVLTHFSPAREFNEQIHDGLAHYTTYNALIDPSNIRGGWQRFQQKGLDGEFLVSYGYGDGGGGPTDWMLENARRMKTPLPGVPVVRQMHPREFFEALEKRVKGDPRLPVWSGELYLEYHRGTYTAVAKNKLGNRKTELALRDAEFLCAAAARAGLPYPAEALHGIWQDALTLQFHDILPGSSIKKVYEDSDETYARLGRELKDIRADALRALSEADANYVSFVNTLSHRRDDVVWFDAPEWVGSLRGPDGALTPVQRVEGQCCAFVRGLEPFSITPFELCADEVQSESVSVSADGFETSSFIGAFDGAMRIARLYDRRARRELVKAGEALNRIVCYENKPHNYDAWDINIYYDRRHWDVDAVDGVEVVSCGPVCARIKVRYRYMRSMIEQRITVYRDLGRIDFDTQADWREKQYLLKAHFPVDVFYNEATFDVQYGNVRRATHRNTSWDAARFEVCAHKWVDASEDGYGVSLLNDCKYGHSVDDRGIALTLLKSSTHPDPDADQCAHVFTYSLMPHEGNWREAGTQDMALKLNIPVIACEGRRSVVPPFASVDAPNVLIEVVKQAADGRGLIIRLYEFFGRRTPDVRLTLGFDATSIRACNLLEDDQGEVAQNTRTAAFSLRPYEIKTLRIL
ncbi:alpha-mannosidase [Bacillota bacterium Meth-B3]